MHKQDAVNKGRTTLVFSAFIVVLALAALDQTIVSTALPVIAQDLHERSRLSWVFSSYLIASTVVIPLYGKLGDLYGRKLVLQVAIALFLAGSILCGLSTGMTELIVFRGLQGAGGGGLMTLTMAAVGDLVPDRERGRYLGILGATYGITTLFGPPLGGVLVEHMSWRWIFYINIPLGLVVMLVLAVSFRHRAAPRKHSVDYLGAVLLTAALVMMLISTKISGAFPDAMSPDSSVYYPVLALVFAVGFLWVETRSPEPILPLKLFRHPGFAAANAISAILGVSMFTAIVFLPLYLQIAKGVSPTASGMQVLPMTLGIAMASIGCGRLVARGFYRQFALAGCALVAVASALLATMPDMPADMEIPGYMLVLGLGLGMLFPVVTMAAQNSVSIQDMGTATAAPIMFRSVGGAIGVSLLGSLFSSRIAHEFSLHFSTAAQSGVTTAATGQASSAMPGSEVTVMVFSAALHPLFWITTAIAVIGFGIAWMLPGELTQSEYGQKPAEASSNRSKQS